MSTALAFERTVNLFVLSFSHCSALTLGLRQTASSMGGGKFNIQVGAFVAVALAINILPNRPMIHDK
jgi:hypothetical protein